MYQPLDLDAQMIEGTLLSSVATGCVMSPSPAVLQKAMPGQERQNIWIPPKSSTSGEKENYNLPTAGTRARALSEEQKYV